MAIRTPRFEREVEADADDPPKWPPGPSLTPLAPSRCSCTPPPPLRPLPNSGEESESDGPDRWQMHPAPVLARQGRIREMAFLRGGVVHYLPNVVKCNAHVASSAIAVRFVHVAHAEVMDGILWRVLCEGGWMVV